MLLVVICTLVRGQFFSLCPVAAAAQCSALALSVQDMYGIAVRMNVADFLQDMLAIQKV